MFRLYFNLIPESLVASMLDPAAYGSYMAVGLHGLSRGAAIFFEINPALLADGFSLEEAQRRCVADAQGNPKRSVYLSIYRVLEKLPLEAFGKLYLTTDDGRVLELERAGVPPDGEPRLHLYQEFCPVSPRVASKLSPRAFCRHITEPGKPVSVPRIAFCELMLRDLALDPANAPAEKIPYRDLPHHRECLIRLVEEPDKQTKIVVRHMRHDVLFHTIRHGIFVGDQNDMLYYPMPAPEELEDKHHAWWRSALTTHQD